MVYYRIACYYESKGGDLEGKMFWGWGGRGRKNGGKEGKEVGLIKGVRI